MENTSAHPAHGALRNPGPYAASAGVRTGFLALAVLGAIVFVIGLITDPTRAWAAFVLNHFFFMSLAILALFFSAIQWLTSSMWSAPVRRLMESFTAYLPIALITMILLYFGIHHLYSWSHLEHVRGDAVLEGKSGYLSPVFFTARNVIAIAIWVFFGMKLIGNSIKQDTSRDPKLTLRNRAFAAPFMVILTLTFTMASWDQMMSLDPHWFSTMFGVYCFAGGFYAFLAATCLLTLFLLKAGHLKGLVNDNHLHDLGKLMFAFTIFWAYIGFCQFFLIWYANLPEETGYFMNRLEGTWVFVSIFLFLKFLVPFIFLLPRDAKRNPKVLAPVAVFMLVAHWVDVMWMVQPEFYKNGPSFGWVEIGVLLGFIGVFGFVVVRFLGKNNVVAIGDPRLEESVLHHHQ